MRPFQHVSRNMTSKKFNTYSLIRKSDKINLNFTRYLKDSSKILSQPSHLNNQKHHKSQVADYFKNFFLKFIFFYFY